METLWGILFSRFYPFALDVPFPVSATELEDKFLTVRGMPMIRVGITANLSRDCAPYPG